MDKNENGNNTNNNESFSKLVSGSEMLGAVQNRSVLNIYEDLSTSAMQQNTAEFQFSKRSNAKPSWIKVKAPISRGYQNTKNLICVIWCLLQYNHND